MLAVVWLRHLDSSLLKSKANIEIYKSLVQLSVTAYNYVYYL